MKNFKLTLETTSRIENANNTSYIEANNIEEVKSYLQANGKKFIRVSSFTGEVFYSN
jgi:hypothetical protein